jgi:hypothetical protein
VAEIRTFRSGCFRRFNVGWATPWSIKLVRRAATDRESERVKWHAAIRTGLGLPVFEPGLGVEEESFVAAG